LQSAVRTANTSGGTVHLAAGCTYNYLTQASDGSSSALPVLRGSFTIDGHGATVQRDFAAAVPMRMAVVAPGAFVTLRDVPIKDFHAAAVAPSTGTGTSGQDGGAILNHGLLTVDGCTFTTNWAGNGGVGGACDNSLSGHTGYDGGRGGNGGAIWNDASLSV